MQNIANLLSLEDSEFCRKKPSLDNMLAFGVMLGFFKQNAKFPNQAEEPISNKFISLIASDLGVGYESFTFDWGSKTSERYRCDIRKYLGYRMPRNNDSDALKDYLISDILPNNPSNAAFLENVRLFFHQN
jgi:hypothetical protein